MVLSKELSLMKMEKKFPLAIYKDLLNYTQPNGEKNLHVMCQVKVIYFILNTDIKMNINSSNEYKLY